SLTRGARRAVLPRLLRTLLLPAAVHRLWRACVVRPFAAVQYRRGQRQRGGGGTDCGADPASVAASPDHLAGRFGFLSGRVAELVRRKWGGLCGGLGAKRSPATGDRGGRRRSGGPISAERKSGASLHRVRLSNQKQLVTRPTGDRQSRTLGERGQSPVCGHLAELARNHLSCPVPLGGAKLV